MEGHGQVNGNHTPSNTMLPIVFLTLVIDIQVLEAEVELVV